MHGARTPIMHGAQRPANGHRSHAPGRARTVPGRGLCTVSEPRLCTVHNGLRTGAPRGLCTVHEPRLCTVHNGLRTGTDLTRRDGPGRSQAVAYARCPNPDYARCITASERAPRGAYARCTNPDYARCTTACERAPISRAGTGPDGPRPWPMHGVRTPIMHGA